MTGSGGLERAAPEAPHATREVRWVLEGRLREHPDLGRWYAAIPDIVSEVPLLELGACASEERTDVYLPVPAGAPCGIKVREQRLEVKGLASEFREVCFGRHAGTVQRWLKWSVTAGGALHAAYAEVDGALPLRKSRRTVHLMLSPAGGGGGHALLEVELGDLSLSGMELSTVAFEASPDDELLDALFREAVASCLSRLAGPALSARRSMSYPELVGRTLRRDGIAPASTVR